MVATASYSYRYTREDGTALTHCPVCHGDLEEEGGIDLTLSLLGKIVELPSRLDDGWLEDMQEGAVAGGYHSLTCCGHCGEQMVEWEEKHID